MNFQVRYPRRGVPVLQRLGRSVLLSMTMVLAPAVMPGLAAQSGASAALRPVASDSVARLAVDPARFAGMPYVTLLDEANFRVEPDGRAVHRTRQVLQVLDAAAVQALSERSLGYASSHQSLRVDWVRVLRTSGEVVSDRAAQEQESGVTAEMSNPVYGEQKVRRFSLAGVAVGTIIDVAWTMEERAPPRPGDFYFRWQVNGTIPTVRSRLTLDVPESYTPRIIERNLTVRRREESVGGRHQYTWAATDVSAFRMERFATDSNNVVMSIAITAPGSWSDVASWYHGLSRDRYALSASDAARIDGIVRAAAAHTRADTIRAVHRWVAQDIRYLSVALGIGGYQPRRPEETIATGFGDCKDKATLFVAALRRYGMRASPVLLASAGRPDRTTPTVFQFNHAIAAVREGLGWTFTDLTADLIPYGTVPDSYQGAFGLLVNADGSAEEVTFPVAPVVASSYTTRVAVTLDSSGHAVVHVSEQPRGGFAPSMRSAFLSPLEGERRETLLRSIAGRAFSSAAKADSLVAFEGRDLKAEPTISYRVVADGVLKPVGEARLFSMNVALPPPGRTYAALARELEAAPRRVFPIDAAMIMPAGVSMTEISITLPAGWTVELPKNVLATSFFGRYESTWTVQGREIHLVRRIQGSRGIFPPERIAEVIVWLKAVGADDYEFLSLRPAPVP
jgi:transglutaminase-like putative cysteine protease